jgi:hypothetical protein
MIYMTNTTTFKSASDLVFEAANIPEADASIVRLTAGMIMNTTPGYRPSDAMRLAVSVYAKGGREAVATFGRGGR